MVRVYGTSGFSVDVTFRPEDGTCTMFDGEIRLSVSGMSCCGLTSFLRYAQELYGVQMPDSIWEALDTQHQRDWKGGYHHKR